MSEDDLLDHYAGLGLIANPDAPMDEIRFVSGGRTVGVITNLAVPMTCDTCGVTLDVGMWPFCPHGRGANAVIPDDVPGGFLAVNGFAEPTRFDSHSAHERALAERGLEIRAKHAGPDDTICQRWDTVDLDAAKTLLERGPQAIRERQERWPNATIPITVTIGGVIQQKDLE